MGKIQVKSKEQIEGIRKSCRIAAQTLKFIEPFVKEGVSTKFLNDKIAEFMAKNNATAATKGYRGYPAESCISLNDVVCHGIPSDDTILKNGDILNIDVTTIVDGYFGDTSKMYTVGEVSENAKKLIAVTKKCLDIGIEQVRPGNYVGNIGYEISKYARQKGYGVVYEFCGHGVGLRFHEAPEVSFVSEKDTGPKMKPGITFTIEPMINEGRARTKIAADNWTAYTIDHKLSAQFEHTILVTETGYDVLTDLDGDYA